MEHSGFDFTDLHSPDKAFGYASPESTVPASIVDSSVSFAAGAMYTTVGDLYKWDRGLRAGKIISPASQQQAYTPHLAQYGFGWIIGQVNGKKVLEHGGGITGFISYILRVPENETCIVVLENQGGDFDISKMSRDIYSVLDDRTVKLPKTKVAVNLDTALLRQYIGRYQLAPDFILIISLQDGYLYAQAIGQGKAKLFAKKKDLFFPKHNDAEFEFVRGANGDIEKLILHQDGRDVSGRRL